MSSTSGNEGAGMSVFWTAVGILLILLACFGIWVRLAPSDPLRWHVDPLHAPAGEEGAYVMRPSEGDATAPIFRASPPEVLAAFDRIALSEPRVTRLAGSVAEGQVTYIQRSKLWGFPDYITALAIPADGGSTLAVWSRLRFGRSDMGVNRARVENWVGRMDLPRITGP